MKWLPRRKAEFLRVVAQRIVPETDELDAAGLERFFAIIDSALEGRDPEVRKQFATFLDVVRWAPLARYGQPFEKLSGRRRDAVLRWFEDCPVGVLRSGTWGLKVMVFMGYYGQPENHRLVGYVPDGLYA